MDQLANYFVVRMGMSPEQAKMQALYYLSQPDHPMTQYFLSEAPSVNPGPQFPKLKPTVRDVASGLATGDRALTPVGEPSTAGTRPKPAVPTTGSLYMATPRGDNR